MKYKYKDHYNRYYNFMVRARFNSVDNAKQFMWDNDELVEFEPFGPSLFYFSKFDGSFHYTPIPPKGKFTTLRRMKIDYNEGTLDI